ncbi:hypothetical protein BCR34DRAFT_603376 [Clohesyomyces aquaticus]|uniref:Uncharacterized protein n=1 Tax=Clohesyomyces aquaticus TaxID=1231657 RepID=A0A1Y1ZFW8_9PLEO|nr:hypothetical protein BCR34DRAFT_603376 [Clohesyomyces aquaticus]
MLTSILLGAGMALTVAALPQSYAPDLFTTEYLTTTIRKFPPSSTASSGFVYSSSSPSPLTTTSCSGSPYPTGTGGIWYEKPYHTSLSPGHPRPNHGGYQPLWHNSSYWPHAYPAKRIVAGIPYEAPTTSPSPIIFSGTIAFSGTISGFKTVKRDAIPATYTTLPSISNGSSPWDFNHPNSTAFGCHRGGNATGCGSYDDPVPFAGVLGSYETCEVVYHPYLHKYLRYEDVCPSCGNGSVVLWTGEDGGKKGTLIGKKERLIRKPLTWLSVDKGGDGWRNSTHLL